VLQSNVRLGSRLLALAATVASLAIVAGALTGCSVNPATGQRQLTLISEAQEIQLGKESHQQVVAQMGIYSDPKLQQYVDTIGQRLAAESERPNLPWTFTVVDDPIVNAFALPGGFIYITRGILGYMNSEAEMVSVLGHEIGHVTARHSVEQMSKQQLAQVGLLAGMIVSEEFRNYGGLASQGLGLLFLKFSRDDERQADDLGLRYLVRDGYNPREMDNVFRTLGRVSAAQGGGDIPGWASTHPSSESRVARIEQAVATLPPEARGGRIDRDSFLTQLDEVVYGEDPREGFFEDNVFYQPQMRFKLTFPAGWKTINQRAAVGAISPQQDAIVVLELAQQESPDAAAQAFFSQQNVERGGLASSNFYNFRTLTQANAQGQKPEGLRGLAGFFSYGGQTFRLLGFTRENQWNSYQSTINASSGTFEALNDPRYLNVTPDRLTTVRLPSAMDLAEFNRRYPSSISLEQLAIVNGVDTSQRFDAGTILKRVTGGKKP
jgi:predicted Zn-dependent protease